MRLRSITEFYTEIIEPASKISKTKIMVDGVYYKPMINGKYQKSKMAGFALITFDFKENINLSDLNLETVLHTNWQVLDPEPEEQIDSIGAFIFLNTNYNEIYEEIIFLRSTFQDDDDLRILPLALVEICLDYLSYFNIHRNGQLVWCGNQFKKKYYGMIWMWEIIEKEDEQSTTKTTTTTTTTIEAKHFFKKPSLNSTSNHYLLYAYSIHSRRKEILINSIKKYLLYEIKGQCLRSKMQKGQKHKRFYTDCR